MGWSEILDRKLQHMCLAFSKHLISRPRLAVVAMVGGVFSAPSSTRTHSPWFRLGVLGVGGGALSQPGGHQHQLPAALPPPSTHCLCTAACLSPASRKPPWLLHDHQQLLCPASTHGPQAMPGQLLSSDSSPLCSVPHTGHRPPL